jgi:hypothetical protein
VFENLLRYANARWLKWGLALAAASVALYASQDGRASGSTWQGYVLGTIAALLIIWLAVLGVRKRSYASALGTVKGWTSAHVYLGVAAMLVASLHSAMQLGWNVHSLAWWLMLAVVVSGFWGVHAYVNLPRALSDNRGGGSREALFAELYELDRKGEALARRCAPDIQSAVTSSIENTAVGGGVWLQLTGADRSRMRDGTGALVDNREQAAVIGFVAGRIPRSEKSAEVVVLQELLPVLSRRQAVARRLRRDIRLQGWLAIWLYVHVPLKVALLVALVVHVVTTFLYW